MSLGEEPLGPRESEREVIHTEVRRLHACKSVLGKFVFPSVLSVGQECTASHDFQRTDRQSRSPPENTSYTTIMYFLRVARPSPAIRKRSRSGPLGQVLLPFYELLASG